MEGAVGGAWRFIYVPGQKSGESREGNIYREEYIKGAGEK